MSEVNIVRTVILELNYESPEFDEYSKEEMHIDFVIEDTFQHSLSDDSVFKTGVVLTEYKDKDDYEQELARQVLDKFIDFYYANPDLDISHNTDSIINKFIQHTYGVKKESDGN